MSVTLEDAANTVARLVSEVLVAKGCGDMDGPSYLYFTGTDGNKYEYKVFSLGSEDLGNLQQFMAQVFHTEPDGSKIVWRCRPEIDFKAGTKKRKDVWLGYMRYVSVPASVMPVLESEPA